MSTLILNDETAHMPLGQLLHSTNDSNIEIRDEAGGVVAQIFLHTLKKSEVCQEHSKLAEAEIDELRRRANDRRGDVTTAELLARLKSL